MMDFDILSLWCAYPADTSQEELGELGAAILSIDEKERARAFQFAEDRHEFVTAHVLPRRALSHHFPLAPHEWQFEAGANGKPRLLRSPGLRFNLSHTKDLVMCAISSGIEVGIDTEPRTRSKEIEEIASQLLSLIEAQQMQHLSEQDKCDRFVDLWTGKEAFTKACGLGLSLPLKDISFSYSHHEDVKLEIDSSWGLNADRFQFGWYSLSGHRVAIATERSMNLRVQLFELRPLDVEPECKGFININWHPRIRS